MPGATVGAALSGDVVRISIAALPSHVRTARLVSGATARRAGLDDGSIDELKLAVGEACTRAVELHASHAPLELVDIDVSWTSSLLTVAVSDRGPGQQLPKDSLAELASPETDDPGPGELALALVQGLVDDVEVIPRDGGGTVVLMRWPVHHDGLADV